MFESQVEKDIFINRLSEDYQKNNFIDHGIGFVCCSDLPRIGS